MSETVLSLSGIVKVYRRGSANEIRVLDGASISIRQGEIVGLVAPSGAGKSTLLHIAGLLDKPDSGSLFVCGATAVGASDRVRTELRRRRIGFVYQFHHLLPEFTALENIVLPQLVNGATQAEAAARAKFLLDSVGLSDRTEHRPAELSGGEQQRTAVCRALANGPKILLADEPTGNLDAKTSEQVFEMMLEVVRTSGLAAIVATHNVALANRMDRTVHLEQGQIFDDVQS
ncbi:MAG: ABC transporter ATP-binding protein [Rhodobacteraceae bacterium]|nr:ABC transporter ATP-binding protein [Paracoccaceae bacterium]